MRDVCIGEREIERERGASDKMSRKFDTPFDVQ